MKPPPAFQFYAADWLSSTSIALMSATEERGYLRLLLHEWADEDCSLPDDHALMKRLALVKSERELKTILRQFEAHPTKPGRLVNARLFEERRKQDEFRAMCSEAGKASARSKRQRTFNERYNDRSTNLPTGRPTERQPEGQPKVNSSSSSSTFGNSPPTPQGERERRERLSGTPETRVGRGPVETPSLVTDDEKREKWRQIRQEHAGKTDPDQAFIFSNWLGELERERGRRESA